MTSPDRPALLASTHPALATLDAALSAAGLGAHTRMLLAPSAGAVLALADSPAVQRARQQLPGAAEVVVLPPVAALGLDGAQLLQALAGRPAFTVTQALLQAITPHLPGNTVVGLGGRQCVHVGATQATGHSSAAPHDLAMYCKSYRGDLQRVQVMLQTWRRFNRDNIPLYLSCPADDLPLFAPLAGAGVTLISDESFAAPYLTDMGMEGMSAGYVNQQICKLSFYRTGYAANHVNLDSDTVFIRPFGVADFMHAPGVPYTVLVMDKDLSIERHYRPVHWVPRQQKIAQIYQTMGLDDRRLRTCHGAQVFNAAVLASLHDDFMHGKGWSHVDMLRAAPYEFTWYNAWFQRCKLVPEHAVEPFFKILHMRPDYIVSRLKMLREADYAQAYVGIIMNSKWRPATPLRYADPGESHAAFYNAIMADEAVIDGLMLQAH